jgi:hypothetical protein
MPRNDDPTIQDDVVLWRAVHPTQILTNPDGTRRPQSVAFRNPDNEVSAFIAAELALGWFRTQFQEHVIAEITARDARECGNVLVRDTSEGNRGHVLICPSVDKPKNKIIEDARLLASRAELKDIP